MFHDSYTGPYARNNGERRLTQFAASSRETLWAEAGVTVGLVAAETTVQTRAAGAFVDI